MVDVKSASHRKQLKRKRWKKKKGRSKQKRGRGRSQDPKERGAPGAHIIVLGGFFPKRKRKEKPWRGVKKNTRKGGFGSNCKQNGGTPWETKKRSLILNVSKGSAFGDERWEQKKESIASTSRLKGEREGGSGKKALELFEKERNLTTPGGHGRRETFFSGGTRSKRGGGHKEKEGPEGTRVRRRRSGRFSKRKRKDLPPTRLPLSMD